MGLFDRSPKATRQTVVQAVGAGSIAAGGNITGTVVTGDNNRVASATSHGNEMGDVVMNLNGQRKRGSSVSIVNGLTVVSDGTWKGELKIEDGKLFVNGRLTLG